MSAPSSPSSMALNGLKVVLAILRLKQVGLIIIFLQIRKPRTLSSLNGCGFLLLKEGVIWQTILARQLQLIVGGCILLDAGRQYVNLIRLPLLFSF